MPLYDFMCASEHVTELFFSVAAKPKSTRCACGKVAQAVILTVPAVHTIQTFHRDIDDPFVKKHADKSGYLDPNLGRDRKTGKRTKITSIRQREQLMREAGLYELPPDDSNKDVARLKKKPVHMIPPERKKKAANG
jgi:hypothetical protein